MCATAANLVERVPPQAPLRQWVLTFPCRWRKRRLAARFRRSAHSFVAAQRRVRSLEYAATLLGSIVANDKAEADRVFSALSAGGAVHMPLANAPWGPYFGMCVDRFGVQWMVSLPNPV